MIFYAANKPKQRPDILTVKSKGACYHPVIHHTGLEDVPANNYKKPKKPHTDSFYHIILYVQGTGKFWWQGEKWRFAPGTVVVSWPGVSHFFHSLGGEEFAYLEVTFSLEDNQGRALKWPFHRLLAHVFGLTVPPCKSPWGMTPPYRRRLEQNLSSMPQILFSDSKMRWGHAFQTLLDSLSILTQESVDPNPEVTGAPLKTRLEKIRDYIERNFNDQLSIGRLAEQSGLSSGHFIRTFKHEFGVPPFTYQQNLRIQVATSLLESEEYRIAEIGRRVGFQNPYYFSRLFRKRTGLSPREYRHRYRKNI